MSVMLGRFFHKQRHHSRSQYAEATGFIVGSGSYAAAFILAIF